jgi:hypothetical protein
MQPNYCHRDMRTSFNFTVLVVFSCIAVIGATPLGARAPAEAIGRRTLYVAQQQMERF